MRAGGGRAHPRGPGARGLPPRGALPLLRPQLLQARVAQQGGRAGGPAGACWLPWVTARARACVMAFWQASLVFLPSGACAPLVWFSQSLCRRPCCRRRLLSLPPRGSRLSRPQGSSEAGRRCQVLIWHVPVPHRFLLVAHTSHRHPALPQSAALFPALRQPAAHILPFKHTHAHTH